MCQNVSDQRACYLVFKLFVNDPSKNAINLHYPPRAKAEFAWNAIHIMSSCAARPEEIEQHPTQDFRKLINFSLYTLNELVLPDTLSSQKLEMPSTKYSEKETTATVNMEAGEEDLRMFYCGHPDIEKTRGYMKLYRTYDTFDIDDISTCMLTILAIPATLAVDQLLRFVQNFMDKIQKLQILFQTDSPFYMAFILFFSEEKCRSFYKELNGRPFSVLEPDNICHCAFVKEISTQCSQSKPSTVSLSECTLLELPQCIICLERMDESVEGLLTAPCNHEFHLNCLRQYKSTDCPVCRYSIVPDAKTSSICLQCGLSDDLWLCLICGFVGCGRYLNKHAVEHFENTNHTFAKQMESERVWDYARDQYVHRLIQNKGDGKVVEYTVEAPFTIADNDDLSGDSVTLNGHVSVTADEKLDSIQIEYSYLISSELQKQRAYYEEKLKLMEIEAKKKETQLEGRLKGVMDEKKTLEAELTQLQKGKSGLEKRFSEMKNKLDVCEKNKKNQLQEVDEMNNSLLANQSEYKAKISELEKQKRELEETNRDLMFTLSAQQKISTMSPSEKAEINTGSIKMTPSAVNSSPSTSASSSTGAKPKRKSHKR